MNFPDDALLPENQQRLVIQVAPYGPEFLPEDSTDIPVTMDEQIQKAVDCWNAGATVLHVHCREADGKGSKRLSMFNEMLDRLRSAVPKMVLQVGGSISFARPSLTRAHARCLCATTSCGSAASDSRATFSSLSHCSGRIRRRLSGAPSTDGTHKSAPRSKRSF